MGGGGHKPGGRGGGNKFLDVPPAGWRDYLSRPLHKLELRTQTGLRIYVTL